MVDIEIYDGVSGSNINVRAERNRWHESAPKYSKNTVAEEK
jgi:hypothetical protein